MFHGGSADAGFGFSMFGSSGSAKTTPSFGSQEFLTSSQADPQTYGKGRSSLGDGGSRFGGGRGDTSAGGGGRGPRQTVSPFGVYPTTIANVTRCVDRDPQTFTNGTFEISNQKYCLAIIVGFVVEAEFEGDDLYTGKICDNTGVMEFQLDLAGRPWLPSLIKKHLVPISIAESEGTAEGERMETPPTLRVFRFVGQIVKPADGPAYLGCSNFTPTHVDEFLYAHPCAVMGLSAQQPNGPSGEKEEKIEERENFAQAKAATVAGVSTTTKPSFFDNVKNYKLSDDDLEIIGDENQLGKAIHYLVKKHRKGTMGLSVQLVVEFLQSDASGDDIKKEVERLVEEGIFFKLTDDSIELVEV